MTNAKSAGGIKSKRSSKTTVPKEIKLQILQQRVGSSQGSSGGKTIGGLSFKNVKHTINRECMWYHPPHWKPEWRLRGGNAWREGSKGKQGFDNRYNEDGRCIVTN